MPNNKWTAPQERAIASDKKRILVSAAAGSGKTAVLTEKIIRYLTNPEHPGSSSRLLVVTFSRSAAAELRSRIRGAVEKALNENPSDHLATELLTLSGARISTIHSFCYDLIRSEAKTLGLSQNLRLIDEAESAELERRVMDETVEKRLREAKESFLKLSTSLVGAKHQDAVGDYLREFYDTALMNQPNGLAVLRSCAADVRAAASGDFLSTHAGTVLADGIRMTVRDFLSYFDAIADELPEDHSAALLLQKERAALVAFENALGNGYGAAREALFAFSFDRFPPAPKKYADGYASVCNAYKAAREELKDFLGTGTKSRDSGTTYLRAVFAQTPEQAARSAAAQADLLDELCETMERFDARLAEAKRRMAVCNFSDLEQYAVRLLYNEDGSFSEIAHATSAAFDRIYIDEYQDVNQCQKMIFDAVSCDCAVFRVGDVKQSIYGFRGADPSIIDRLRRLYESGSDPDAEAVFMSHNFRSGKKILAFANAVFEPLFRGGRFSYTDDDRLCFGPDVTDENGKIKDEAREAPIRILLAPPKPKKGDEEAEAHYCDEPNAVADEVLRLVREEKNEKGEPFRFRDVALLFRATKTHAAAFLDAFRAHGIPVVIASDSNFFAAPHVALFLSILRTADNPLRDVPLAAVLGAPLFGFTPDELFAISHCDGTGLWQKLKNAAATSEKAAVAVAEIERWRDTARRLPCDAVVRFLAVNRGVTEMLCGDADPEQRKTVGEDIDYLYGMARDFEQSGAKGLAAFVEYLEQSEANGKKRTAELSAGEDAVRFMTIHASKGLQFPVCFLVKANTAMADQDRDSLVHCPGVGIGLFLTDPRGFVKLHSPHRLAIRRELICRGRDESARDLYVALTRPIERLYITGVTPTEANRAAGEALAVLTKNRHAPMGMHDFLSAALSAADRTTGLCEILTATPAAPSESPVGALPEAPTETPDALARRADALRKTLETRLGFEYPDDYLSRIPAKLSVSNVTPTVLNEAPAAVDADAAEAALLRRRELPDFAEAPSFVTGETQPNAAEAGTATHQFLQFCDFARAAGTGAAAEAEKLCADGFLTERQRSCLRLRELDAFLSGGFCRRLRDAEMLRREFRFNCFLPADRLTDDPALAEKLRGHELAVQGVIDGFFLEEGKVWLFDYKTDRMPKGEDAVSFGETLAARYNWQLSCYAAALKRIFGAPIAGAVIYSTATGLVYPVSADLLTR